MDKKRLFSIGKLSKLTGVHIQSLRYYESLGLLKPAFVDPDSGYRYYTFSQTRIVEAVQYCVELDIPLKAFRAFLSQTDGRIDYAGLLEYGKQTAYEKMHRIQERLYFLESMQQEMCHAESCSAQHLIKACFPERQCWTIPYEGTQTDSDFHAAMYRMITEIERHGLHAGFNNGQLLRYTEQGARTYLFIDLRETGNALQEHSQIMRIPGGEYLCTVSRESRIKQAPAIFAALFRTGSNRVVVEVELFAEQFHYADPVYELRCSAANDQWEEKEALLG